MNFSSSLFLTRYNMRNIPSTYSKTDSNVAQDSSCENIIFRQVN